MEAAHQLSVTETTYSQRSRLPASTSVVLDGLRVGAALVVVGFHVSSQLTTAYPAMHDALGKASHAAVMLFFVISGYVIAFTTADGSRGPRQYAVARLSRLYSMLLPALLLTALVEYAVVHADALLAARYVRAHSWVRYGLTAVFGNESGSLSAAPPLNSPLWSLSYEFWYYLLFGLWFYGRKGRRMLVWMGVASLLAGPKILLLLPVWLGGVLAFRLPKPAFLVRNAGIAAGLFLGLAGLAVAYLPALPGALGSPPLFLAAQFATDWLVGALMALAIWCLPAARPQPPVAFAGAQWLRAVADLSFPLYVLHFPLIVLWRVLFGTRLNDLPQMWTVIVTVSLVAGLLGLGLERQRRHWICFFDRLIEIFSRSQKPL